MVRGEGVRALLDTSVVIGGPQPADVGEACVSAMTLAELHYGVLHAPDAATRTVRLRRLALVESEFDPLPIDGDVARAYGAILAAARAAGRRPRTADVLIAATATANGLPVYTRDRDFEHLPGVRAIILA
ncbi:MAG: PIN domain-containing protein [Solirubrobacteraceae bacterium]